MNDISLLIAVPSSEYVPVEFMKCLMEFTRQHSENKVKHAVSVKTGSFLPHTRASAMGASMERGVNQAPYNGKFTHILAIDTDIMFDFADFKKLLAHNVSFVSGLYCYANQFGKKEDEKLSVCGYFDEEFFLKHNIFPSLSLKEATRKALVSHKMLCEVGWCGLGFCLMRSDIFNSISYPWFESEKIVVGPYTDTSSEDVGFCRKLTAAGHKLYADPFVKVGHYKHYVV